MSTTARYSLALWIISILFVSNSLYAAKKTGPHGGRIFRSGKAVIEFNVDKTGHPHVFRLNEKGVPVAWGAMQATMKALTPKKTLSIKLTRTTEGLGIEPEGNEHLAGALPMPGPDEYPVEISVKLGSLSRKFRFEYIEGFCAECGLPGFACTCN